MEDQGREAREYAAGLRAAADFIEENAAWIRRGNLDGVRSLVFCTSLEEWDRWAALAPDVAFAVKGEYVEFDIDFGSYKFHVYARAETVLEVGRWRFVDGLEHLNDRLPQDETVTV